MKPLTSIIAGLLALGLGSSAIAKTAVSVEGDQSWHGQWSNFDNAVQEAGYDLRRIWGEEDTILREIKTIYDKSGPIDILQFEMHGSPYVMKLGGIGSLVDDIDTIDLWDVGWFKELRGYLAPNAPIILESCNTGYGHNSLAAMMAFVTGHTVYAPSQAIIIQRENNDPTSEYVFSNGVFQEVHFYGFEGYQGPFSRKISSWRLLYDTMQNFDQRKVDVTTRFDPQPIEAIGEMVRYTLYYVDWAAGSYTIEMDTEKRNSERNKNVMDTTYRHN